MLKPRWFTPQVLGLFRERADGDWDFPFGRFGPGYRVRSFDMDDLWNALLRFQTVLIVALSFMFAAAGIAISHIGGSAGGGTAREAMSLIAFVSVVVLGILLWNWYVRRLVKDFPLAETQLTRVEANRLWAPAIRSRSYCYVLFCFCWFPSES